MARPTGMEKEGNGIESGGTVRNDDKAGNRGIASGNGIPVGGNK